MQQMRKVLNTAIPLMLFMLISILLCLSMAEPYQIPKELQHIKAMCLFMVLIFFERKIPLKRYATWALLALAAISIAVLFYVRGINAQNYGEVYSRVIWFRTAVVVAAIVILFDSVISREIIDVLKRANLLWYLFIGIAVAAVIVQHNDYVPLIIPIFALLLTDIKAERWVRLMDYFSVGYYISFCYLFTKSLIVSPSIYVEDRYVGIFTNNRTAGMIAGSTIILLMYLAIRIFSAGKSSVAMKLILLFMLIYPAYALMKVGSRSPMCGVIFAGFAWFVFLAGKGKNSIKKRVVVIACVAFLMVAGMYAFSIILNLLCNSGRVDASSLNYFEAHIMTLTNDNGLSRDDALDAGQFINGLNAFSAGRLYIWLGYIKQIGFHKVDGPLYTRNFFIDWMLRYGLIIGLIFIVWFLGNVIACVRKDARKDITGLFPTLWVAYCLAVFNFTSVDWLGLVPFVLLISQYPCLFKSLEKEFEAPLNIRGDEDEKNIISD